MVLAWQGMSRTRSCATLEAGDQMLEGAAGHPAVEGGPSPPLKRVKTEQCDVDLRKRVMELELELASLKVLT